ncbi:MAG: Mce-associated rane protein [Actinomycetota bacterium]|nr:Mce-associated rane protein [Actinomycetota bacterium]
MFARLKRWLPWILVVLFLASTALFGVLWFQLRQESDKEDEARAAARDFITALTNFSAETIDTDTAEIRSYAVGDFKEEADTFFGPKAVAAIKQAEAVSESEIETLFVQSLGGEEASVFGVVSQTITNAISDAPVTDTLKLEVGLIETPDGWKVNNVDVFQAPGGGVLGGSTPTS